MSEEAYYAEEASRMNLEIQDIGKQRDDLLAALLAFRSIDDFSGWHPKYRDAIAKAEAAIEAATK